MQYLRAAGVGIVWVDARTVGAQDARRSGSIRLVSAIAVARGHADPRDPASSHVPRSRGSRRLPAALHIRDPDLLSAELDQTLRDGRDGIESSHEDLFTKEDVRF